MDTFAAILGGVAMIVLFVLLAIALVALAGILLLRKLRRRVTWGAPPRGNPGRG